MSRDLDIRPYGSSELWGDIRPLYDGQNLATSFMADGLLEAPGGFDYEPEPGRCPELTAKGYACQAASIKERPDGLCAGHARRADKDEPRAE